MQKAETRIRKKILTALREKFPSGYFRVIHGNLAQHAGIPDIIGCVRGFFIGLEVKTTQGRQSRIQEIEESEICNALGTYAIVTCPDDAINAINSTIGKLGN